VAGRIDPPPPPAVEPPITFPATGTPFATLPDGLAAAVIEADPFSQARVAIEGGDEADTTDEAAEVEVAASGAPAVRLLGVVVLPGGTGSAALSLNAGPTQLVRVGQRVDRYLVRRVAPGTATLEAPDTTLVLRVTPAAAAGVVP
jgi:hypothetical protein